MGIPPIGDAYTYYLSVTIALALITAWVPVACNNPVLCALAPEGNRAIVFSWTTLLGVFLENFSGGLGRTAFSTLVNMFGYDSQCSDIDPRPPFCDNNYNQAAIGRSIVIVAFFGWAITGGLY